MFVGSTALDAVDQLARPVSPQHRGAIILLISSGAAKIMARSASAEIPLAAGCVALVCESGREGCEGN